MENSRLALLFIKALSKEISVVEKEELFALIADPSNQLEVDRLFEEAWDSFVPISALLEEKSNEAMLAKVLKNQPLRRYKNEKNRRIYRPYSVVAAVILLIGISWFIYDGIGQVDHKESVLTLSVAAKESGIAPGSNKAILTLGNGQEIVLSNEDKGFVAEDLGVSISQINKGELHYQYIADKIENDALSYNTIRVPRGGQYSVILPDGTFVHLNAASTIRYPTKFIGNRREVELTGEGYFEVASNQQQPFYVKTDTQEIRVLGTTFNINAYDSQFTKTTLLTGRIKVSNKGRQVILKPGQTSIWDRKSVGFTVMPAAIDEELAWHNGYFIFNNENIKEIMERVARWYDIEVEYRGDMQGKQFGGVFRLSKGIDQLLENFKATGTINFKIAERRVIVMEK